MHYYHFLGWIVMLALASGFTAGIVQTGSAQVCTDPVRLEIGAGQVETLQVMLVNAKKIYGIDLQATFDPAVVQIMDTDPKHVGIQMTPGTFLKPDYSVRNSADNKTGLLRYVITQVNPTPPASGKGVLLTIQFQGKTAGTTSAFTITSVTIADRRGNKQPVTLQGAELVIVSQKTATPTHLPKQTRTRIPTTLPAVRRMRATIRPPVRAWATATPHAPARVAVRQPASLNQVLTYISIGGFSGAALLSGLSVWLVRAKMRQKKKAKVP
jgi:hypothetical protein